MTRNPLRLAALALGIAACGAVALLVTSAALDASVAAVPLLVLMAAGPVGLLGRALGHLRRWGLLIGAGAYVAMAARALTDSGLSPAHSTIALACAVASSALWFTHDIDEAG
ncbi:hypothetical protein AGRA3207_000198 [Actinomadura graeca]|uniref:Uncharacterized protein n=1 Tax=Actinomadura graeca TaxID=2750812 RepID=A0ABX8QM70_9ACTN|nr:hypothetical protein [Actinomadura graeca]QXJ19636.1 hypothetical protein AGRA3207_000198 [Actinomadura graeca]